MFACILPIYFMQLPILFGDRHFVRLKFQIVDNFKTSRTQSHDPYVTKDIHSVCCF